MKRLLTACACALLIGAAPAPAAGIRSSGTLVVQANISGEPLTVGGNIALYRRANMYRLDLLSLGFPGAGAAASAAAGALLGSGSATILYDGSTGALTAYSNANRTYYTEAPKSAAAAPAPASGSAAPAAPADPLGALAGVTRQLHDVQRAAILFTGHGSTNGHPVSDIDVQLKRQQPGKPLEDYHAQLALADDLDGFPVRILFSSVPATSNSFGGNLRIDLTTVQRDTPADAVFAVPSGYARVTSIGDVLRRPS